MNNVGAVKRRIDYEQIRILGGSLPGKQAVC